MNENAERRDGKGYSFLGKGGWFMVRCHECGRENYAMAVPTGECAFCGYNANNTDAIDENGP